MNDTFVNTIEQRRLANRSRENNGSSDLANGSLKRYNSIEFDMESVLQNQRQVHDVTGTIHSGIRRSHRTETSNTTHGHSSPDLMVGNPNGEQVRTYSGSGHAGWGSAGERPQGRGSAGERPHDVMPRVPVAPSIPQRGSGADLSLGMDNSETTSRKPPSGVQTSDVTGNHDLYQV